MAALIPDEKCYCMRCREIFVTSSNAIGYHPGTVMPSAAKGALINRAYVRLEDCLVVRKIN